MFNSIIYLKQVVVGKNPKKMANMKTPIFDLNKSGTGNPTVSLEDPVTRRNVWTDILQNPILSQNYMVNCSVKLFILLNIGIYNWST